MRQGAADLLSHNIRVKQDVFGDRPDRGVPESGGRKIPAPVATLGGPARMVRLAVALDDEPAVDEEVDASDTVDPGLNLKRRTQGAQRQAQEALRSGLRSGVQERSEGPESARKQREYFAQANGIDHTEMQRAVERGDRSAGHLATACLRERFDGIREQARGGGPGVSPVAQNLGGPGGKSARSHCGLNMDPVVIQDEDAEASQERDAVHTHPQAGDEEELVVRVRGEESAVSYPDESACRECSIDVVATQALGSQGPERYVFG